MNEKTPDPTNMARDWLFLFLGIFAMSLSAIFLKAAQTSPLTVGFYRLFFAMLGALPLLFWENKKRAATAGQSPFFSKKRWPSLKFAFAGGLFWCCSLSIWNISVLQSNATTATLINNLAPLWTGILALFFFEGKPTRRFWAGLAIALAGVAAMFWKTLSHFQVHWTTWALLVGSFSYSFYLIFQKRGREKGLSAIELLFWVNLVACILFAVECLAMDAPFVGFSTKTWLSMAAAGLISSLLGWGLIGHAMLRLPITITALALLLQAVFIAILDFLIFGVQLNGFQILGGIVVILGLGLVVLKRD